MSSLLERLGEALAPQRESKRELGSIGMATVFLARDLTHDGHVLADVLQPVTAKRQARE
jgi:hypothetical protein